MYRINQVRLPIDFDKSKLNMYLATKLKIDKSRLSKVKLSKLSIDARDKSNVHYTASIVFDVQGKFDIARYKFVEHYVEPVLEKKAWQGGDKNIIVVGSGPSGLFTALRLSESGARVTVLERGYSMEKRKLAVDKLMSEGVLDEKSNIQFGEGGAGTFSDGKLNTGIKSSYIGEVLNNFVKFGASEDILYDSHPHIGTDVLSQVIVNMRKYLESLGVKFMFEHQLVDVKINLGQVVGVVVKAGNKEIILPADIVVLAIGHSSRDTIRMLYERGVEFRQKPFSLGFRVEHVQEDVDYCQYGDSFRLLPPADYHLSHHINDRVVYSFCMCPGGVVVPAMSENNTVVTNGMSYRLRDGENANSALLVSVATSDFPSSHPLSGIELQEKYERYAYEKTGSYLAVVQRVGDFLAGTPTKELGRVKPTYKPGYVLGSVEDMLPDFVITSLKTAIPELSRKYMFFSDNDAIFTGVETRSSAPYQVVRNDTMQCNIAGVYAIGEGAGFAGGIVSSAVEGYKCADMILDKTIDKIQ